MMNTQRLVIAGFGGQGVLTIGQLMAMLGMKRNYAVSWMPSYGPEMRGGTANCHVVIDEKEVDSPLIASNISVLVALNQPALDKFKSMLASDAIIIRHSALTHNFDLKDQQKDVAMDFSAIATQFNSTKSLNMAVFGALVKHLDVYSYEEGKAVIEEKLGHKNESLLKVNLEVYTYAYQLK